MSLFFLDPTGNRFAFDEDNIADIQQYIQEDWTQVAELPPLPTPAVDISAKLDALWRSADAYTSSYISGVAIGLLTIGTLQRLPKALSVTAWSSSVWDEYYRRKALVTATSEDDLDFSSFGPMPHSVPELREELGL
jgi:hypothetical protein